VPVVVDSWEVVPAAEEAAAPAAEPGRPATAASGAPRPEDLERALAHRAGRAARLEAD
jgi:hypothetical protein